MVAVFRAIALVFLVLAITFHVVGIATNSWVTATLEPADLHNMMKAIKFETPIPEMTLNYDGGLWRHCVETKLEGQTQTQSPEIPTGSFVTACRENKNNPTDNPGWLKGVKALCILSLIGAAMSLALMIYSCVGDGKGDRARLFPYITAGSSFVAGLVLLIGVVVFAAEYVKLIGYDTSQLPPELVSFMKQLLFLGYSFGLEVTAAVLYFLIGVILILAARKGWNTSFGVSSNVV